MPMWSSLCTTALIFLQRSRLWRTLLAPSALVPSAALAPLALSVCAIPRRPADITVATLLRRCCYDVTVTLTSALRTNA